MSDLFTSLVDRTLGRAPVLQRRQPTLFEPAVDAAFSVPSLQEQVNVVESEPLAGESKQFSKKTAPTPQPQSPLEELEAPVLENRPARPRQVRDSPAPEEQVDTTRVAPVSSPPVRDTTHEEPTRDAKPSAFVPAPKPLPLTPERRIETIVEKRTEREVIKEQTSEQPAIKEIQTLAQPNLQQKPPHREDRASTEQPSKPEVKHLPAPKEATAIKPLAPKTPPPQRDTPPRLRAAARAEAKRRPQSPAPMINVTIGRVEVRASTPIDGKTHAARPAGPRLTLDDYLRSRVKETK
jgi:hypothetical protein